MVFTLQRRLMVTEIRVYTNGKETGKGPQRGEFQASDLPLTIGHDLRPILIHFAFMNGVMDEVIVADKALTGAEIKDAMELGGKRQTDRGVRSHFCR